MPTDKPVSLGALLNNPRATNESSALAQLKRNAERMEDLANSLRGALPNSIKPHLVSANVRDDRLILVADSAVWAARMRFYASDLSKYMAAIHTSNINRIDIRVSPDWQPAEDGDALSDLD